MSLRRAFIVMPFGLKKAADGGVIDFDPIYRQYLKPAVEQAGLSPHRADADKFGGSIHADMFQELLLAELVIADLTIDNPNVWYEIGVRHALRSAGVVMTYALRDKLPFDVAGQRMVRYSLAGGKLEDGKESERPGEHQHREAEGAPGLPGRSREKLDGEKEESRVHRQQHQGLTSLGAIERKPVEILRDAQEKEQP